MINQNSTTGMKKRQEGISDQAGLESEMSCISRGFLGKLLILNVMKKEKFYPAGLRDRGCQSRVESLF